MLRINDITPNFDAETTQGKINFHDWIGSNWTVFFSHPKDFTPVCTTELGHMANIHSEFTNRDCKLIGLSVDDVDSHIKWTKDIEEINSTSVSYPIIADTNLSIAKLYNMLPADEGSSHVNRTAAQNATVRSVFIIDPDKKIRLMMTYPMTTGRNFKEILRAIDSIQLTSKHKVATPANWENGDDVIIAASVSDDEARGLFKKGWRTVKSYLRIVDQP